MDLVSYLNSPLKGSIDNDEDGSETIAFLECVKAGTARVFGRHPGSLALHPGIYCYGETGKFIPKAFIGAVGFVGQLDEKKWFSKFTECRVAFETFLLAHRGFVKQIGKAQGSGGRRGVPALINLYMCALNHLSKNASEDAVIAAIKSDKTLSFLSVDEDKDDELATGGSRFGKDDKSIVLLRESLAAELRCPICNGWLYRKNLSKDHKVRRQDGGGSSPSNLQLTHPYCNTGFKEAQIAAQRARGASSKR